MEDTMANQYLAIALSPLFGAIVAGLFGRRIGRAGAHWITIAAVGVSCVLSLDVLWKFIGGEIQPYNGSVYTWMVSGGYRFEVGFLVDTLTAVMMAAFKLPIKSSRMTMTRTAPNIRFFWTVERVALTMLDRLYRISISTQAGRSLWIS